MPMTAPMREPDQIRQGCSRKLRSIRVRSMDLLGVYVLLPNAGQH